MTPDTPVRASNASRYLFLFLLGMVVGGAITALVLQTVRTHRDPFPDSVMQVMEKQFGLLDDSINAKRCTSADTLPRFQVLRAIANDVEIAFPYLAEDAGFRNHASQLRANLDAIIASAPANCDTTRASRAKAVEECKACHRDFAD